MIKLVHASISEHGTSGWDGNAQAGDQTGREVCVRSWYSKPWSLCLRYSNETVAAAAAAAAVKLASSGLVGYDQSQRNTLYRALRKYGYDVDAYIRSGVKTETDCSALVYACYCIYIPSMRSDANAPTTGEMREYYGKRGFSALTGAEYTSSPDRLRNGDILVKPNGHTAMATDGSTSAATSPPKEAAPTAASTVYSPEIASALDAMARDVIAGRWGTGTDRRDRIYAAVQARVNEILHG